MKKGYKRNIPVILQMEALECGAASLAMVLGAYGRHLPLERLRSDCGVSRDGSNAKNIAIAARHHGMEVKAYRYSAAQLRQQEKDKFPMIIHWDFNHFVVLCASRKKTAVLHDPAVGKVEVPWEQFEKSYTGVCLILSPGETFTPCGKEKNALDFVRERLKGYGVSSMLLIGAGLFLSLLGMAAPVSTKLFTDYVLLERSGEWMRNLAVLMLTVLFLTFGMNLFQIGLLYRIRGKMTVELSVEFLWHTLILPMEFYGQRTAGDIASRQADTDQVAGILFERVIPAVTNGVMAILYFGVLWYYDVKMAWIALAAAAANFLAVQSAAKKNSSDNRMLTRDEAKLSGSAMAAVSMIETVKASGAEEGIFSKLSGYQARYNNTKYAIRNRNAWLSNLPTFFTDFSGAVILALGVEKIMGGSFTIGVMVAFQGFFLSFLNPVNALLAVSEDLYRLRGKLERIEDVRAYPPDAGTGRWQHDGNQRLSGRIQLSHVSFGYQPLAAPLIPDFSLDIQPGEMTALAGGSGSGKSTIANLITGLYQVRDGKILFDGKTRTEIDRYVFVNSLSIVDQNIVIFQDTIRNNLTLWDASIPESRLIEACKDACIYDEITKYAEGFDYQLCEGGGNLSGGQRQRIEIARALVSEPSILILDEATSALDPLTEKRVMDAVKRRGITCLVIAHRLSAIRDADQIILLEHGSEVERGTHESLLQKEGGRYQALIKSEG